MSRGGGVTTRRPDQAQYCLPRAVSAAAMDTPILSVHLASFGSSSTRRGMDERKLKRETGGEDAYRCLFARFCVLLLLLLVVSRSWQLCTWDYGYGCYCQSGVGDGGGGASGVKIARAPCVCIVSSATAYSLKRATRPSLWAVVCFDFKLFVDTVTAAPRLAGFSRDKVAVRG